MNRKAKISLVLVAAIAALSSGCVQYVHDRPGIEKTVVTSFLYMGKASKVKTTTKDGTYSRSVSIGSVEGQGDVEMLNALIQAGATAAATGAKTAIK